MARRALFDFNRPSSSPATSSFPTPAQGYSRLTLHSIGPRVPRDASGFQCSRNLPQGRRARSTRMYVSVGYSSPSRDLHKLQIALESSEDVNPPWFCKMLHWRCGKKPSWVRIFWAAPSPRRVTDFYSAGCRFWGKW